MHEITGQSVQFWTAVRSLLVEFFALWGILDMDNNCLRMESNDILDPKGYRDPAKVVQYIDFTENLQKDNSRYVPKLVPGVLQPLEVNEIMDDDPAFDALLSNLDIEGIVQQAEKTTKDYESAIQKDYEYFLDPLKSSVLDEFSKKFAPSTKKKALWAGRIFVQWKCIWNFKLKQNNDLDNIITTNLINMEIAQLNEVLSYFVMEIQKQNGEEYPQETLYKIILSLQYYMSING